MCLDKLIKNIRHAEFLRDNSALLSMVNNIWFRYHHVSRLFVWITQTRYSDLEYYKCWKKRYQLSSKSSWPWLVPWRPWWNTPLKIPPLAALVEGISLRWFIFCCEYCISISEIRAHTCYQICYQSRRKNESQKSPYTRESLGNLEMSLSNIKISFT